MTVLMFQERFAPLVQSGTKRQTIRPKRKLPIKPGQHLSLRKWEGKAYRSKQVELRKAKCLRVHSVIVAFDGVLIGGSRALFPESFAKADGFESFADMAQWFQGQHGLPFVGELIIWEPTT